MESRPFCRAFAPLDPELLSFEGEEKQVSASGSHAVVTRQQISTITHVMVAGSIDESFSPAEVVEEANGALVVDLGRVERISSVGVRRWIELSSRLPRGASGFYLAHVPPVVMDQLNMVEGFAGVAQLLSVLAPYRCLACQRDRLLPVDLQDAAGPISQGLAPQQSCPVCSGPTELTESPLEFFDFPRRHPLGAIDPVVTRYLRAVGPRQSLELTAPLKIVEEDVTYFTLPSVLKPDLNTRRLTGGLEGRVAFDFAHVTSLDAAAVPKLLQVLETASETAEVFLGRVPHFVLGALGLSGSRIPGTLVTLWLPCECRTCGNKHQQRVPAASYLAQLRFGESGERPCVICGGVAEVGLFEVLLPVLSASLLSERPLDDLEALETRALSQYLLGIGVGENAARAVQEPTGSGFQSHRLQIIRRLGEGGMAEVFLARQLGARGFEKFLVVKKIRAQFAQSPEFVEMLFAEARANARLTHPNIVQTFDVGVVEGVAQILMEYVRGPDLKRVLKELRGRGIRLPIEHALRIVAEIANALHYSHTYVDPAGTPHPVVHRDVSPHNILISLDGAVKLSDFGIAKVEGEEVTRAGVIKGKISYLSPEAVTGRPLDGRNDVFALGVVLYELLTDTLPFRRDHEAATLNALVREPAPDPVELNPALPRDLADLVLRALVKDPAARIPSAAVMRDEIEALMAPHGWSSSPAQVAQFVSESLGGRLADFEPSGTAVSESASVVAASPLSASVPTSARPLPVPALRPLIPTPVESEGADSRRAMQEAPEPKTVAERSPWLPRQTSTTTLPPSAPTAVTPVMPPRRHPRGHGPPAEESRTTSALGELWADIGLAGLWRDRRGIFLGAATGFLGCLVVGTLLLGSASDAVDHLAPGERLYVSGLRMEPAEVELDPARAQVIATAAGGKLKRYSRVEGESTVDLRTLADASAVSSNPGGPGLLRVVSDPPNCSVQVGSKMVNGFTPLQTAIEAGRELQVTLFCPESSPVSRWVMAVPGQHVELLAKISD